MSIQSAMGWKNDHLYEFNINNQTIIGEPDRDCCFEDNYKDSRKTRLSELIDETELYCKYIYDFGDYWEHWIKISEIKNIDKNLELPICCDGNGNCPPEDSKSANDGSFQRAFADSTYRDTLSCLDFNQDKNITFDKDRIVFWEFDIDDVASPPSENEIWIKRLSNGNISINELIDDLSSVIPIQDIMDLHNAIMFKPMKARNKAVIILGHAKGISIPFISEHLFVPTRTAHDVIGRYKRCGVQQSIFNKKKGYKHEDKDYIDKVFSILHAPPSSYGFNRTSWRQEDILKVMKDEGMRISKTGLSAIVKKSGYSYKKARTVLTSNDPEYREKLDNIINILSNLGSDEKFFSIDEYGPFAIKIKGGKSLTPSGVIKSIPQWQKSKGSLILTAALELSTNQVTHFYSDKKNTNEMIKLLWKLLEKYPEEKTIYFSWDAASWHASKKLYETVEKINSKEYRNINNSPIIKLAPLPTCAQFLNVIESVFSGMARAIIHNSDYKSTDECKEAINKYFEERNERYQNNPKRAGNKIWGKERVKSLFSESNNCKDPRYR